jgi:hypothetical protein
VGAVAALVEPGVDLVRVESDEPADFQVGDAAFLDEAADEAWGGVQ